jgi:hypothetical protein
MTWLPATSPAQTTLAGTMALLASDLVQFVTSVHPGGPLALSRLSEGQSGTTVRQLRDKPPSR